MTEKAFAYLRVSGASQVERNGFDRQLETISDYARSHGFEIARVFKEEGVSGTKDTDERPAFKEMVTEILADGCRTIIVERLDRLARDLMVQNSILAYLKSKDIVLIDAGTGENVIEAMDADPMRKAMVRMQGIFSELEKDQLVRKLRHARDKLRAERGRCEGPAPYGQTEEEARIVRRIRAFRRNKRGGHKGLTYRAIADRLNEEGIRAPNGGLWAKSTIHAILHRR